MAIAVLPARGALPASLASSLPASPALPAWSLSNLSGRLVEISAGPEAAHLTAAFALVLEAQLTGDRAAWVTLENSVFFPPDVFDGGVDLDALPVVRVPDARLAGRAADHLARSGGFGLVVIDLCDPHATTTIQRTVPVPLLTRLLGLAREHGAAIVLLTRKRDDSPSMHSLISLRVEARWRPSTRLGADACDRRQDLCLRALKDKRRGPGWTHVEICRGPAGMR